MQFGHEKGDGLYTLELSLGFEKVSLRSFAHKPSTTFFQHGNQEAFVAWHCAATLAAPALLIQTPPLLPLSGLLSSAFCTSGGSVSLNAH